MKKRCKSFISLLLCVLMLTSVWTALPVTVTAADDQKCGENVTWSLADNVLTISGTGEMYDYSQENRAPWYSNNASINSIVIENGVTGIGDYAFFWLGYVTEVSIADSVTSIGNGSFRAVNHLQSVTIPDSVESIGSNAFTSCGMLRSLEIPDSVTQIGDNAFSYCGEMESIALPSNLTSISSGLLRSCRSLTSVTIPENVAAIGDYAFAECYALSELTIPETVTSVGREAVDGSAFKRLIIDSKNISFHNASFYGVGNNGKAELVLPADWEGTVPDSNGTWYMGHFDLAYTVTFDRSYGMEAIPEQYVKSGGHATEPPQPEIFGYDFDGWYSDEQHTQRFDFSSDVITGHTVLYPHFTEIPHGFCGENLSWMIRDGVLTISGTGAMYDRKVLYTDDDFDRYASSVTKAVVESGAVSVGCYAFRELPNLREVVLPDTVTVIGSDAFYLCKSLNSINIPGSVTSIGNYAFAYTAFTDFVLPEGVTSVGNWAFRDCKSLKSFKFSDSVTSVGQHTFAFCSALENVTFGAGITTIPFGMFYVCESLESFVVPDTVTAIEPEAFQTCPELVYVKIPASVTRVERRVFDQSQNVTVECTPGSAAQTRADSENVNYMIALNEANFPDAAFRSQLSPYSQGGYIKKSAIDNTESLAFTGNQIQSLEGIKAFLKLKSLDCSNQRLSDLDVINLRLESLKCSGNQLNTLTLYWRPLELEMYNQVKPGNAFLGWYLDAELSNPVYDSSSLSDKTIYAKYTSYTITYAQTEFGEVTGPATGGPGENVTLTVIPAPGYILDTLTVKNASNNDVEVTGNSFVMPWSNVTVSATFTTAPIPIYDITIGSFENGSVTADKDQAEAGDPVALTVTPDTGCRLVSLTVKDSSNQDVALTGNTFTMPASSVTVSAVFEKISYTVTCRRADHGSIWTYPNKAKYGDTVKVHPTADTADYQLSEFIVFDENGVPLTVTVTGNSFVMPASNVSVQPVFRQRQAYAVYDALYQTLTFKYDVFMPDGTAWTLPIPDGLPEWRYNTVSKAIFDPYFKNYKPTTTKNWFSNLRYMTEIEGMQYLDTSEVTNMKNMFSGCRALTSVDLSHFDTKKVTDMSGMFYFCEALSSINLDNFYFTKVKKITGMFDGCSQLASLSLWGKSAPELTDMSNLFYNCYNLSFVDIRGIDASKVTNFSSMFYNCRLLTTLSMTGFTTRDARDMSGMFEGCRALTSLDLSGFGTSNVTNMYGMFNNCGSLTALDLRTFETSNVYEMSYMFTNCYSLKTITVGGGWDVGFVYNSFNMFKDCNAIKGGNGTEYDSSHISKNYACIDSAEHIGYLTGVYYTVTWKNYDGSVIDTTSVLCGEMPAHADVTRESDERFIYTFAGWSPQLAPAKYDTAYTAVFTQTLKKYRYNSSTGELVLVWGDFSKNEKWGSDVTRGSVTSVTAESGVRFIGDCTELFRGFGSCTSFDLSNVDTSQMTKATGMFEQCYELTSLDLTGFDTSQVTDMSEMFFQCNKLQTLNVGSFDTSHVTSMYQMFYHCSKLGSLDLSSFNTAKVTNMSRMFLTCDSLASVTVGDNWSTANVTDSTDMISGCDNLTGGAGTAYNDSNPKDKTYAHVDGGTVDPGYFTSTNTVYTITWKNYDGTVIMTNTVRDGETPAYSGSTPVKSADDGYNYVFAGWSPKIAPVKEDTTYTATFTKTKVVSYIDENGETKTVTATVLTGGEETLGEGFYAVTEDVTFSGKLTFTDAASLILCDGKTLTLDSSDDEAFAVVTASLKIFGQENDTGTIEFAAEDADSQQVVYFEELELYGGTILSNSKNDLILAAGSITVNGGNITDTALISLDSISINGGDVSVDTDIVYAIAASNEININGGTVYAKGIEDSIHSEGALNLSWTTENDSVYAENYSGNVVLKKDFTDGNNAYKAGAVEDNTAISGKRLYAAHNHSYGQPVWSWSSDHKQATATFTCTICGHEEAVNTVPVCQLIDHICTEAGTNRYVATVTFEGNTYTDTKTAGVQATQHTWDEGRVMIHVHCMRDGVTRYYCTACGTKDDRIVKCPGSHNFVRREVSYEEFKEETEGGKSAHTHLNNTKGGEDTKYYISECQNSGCDTKLVEYGGNTYLRVGESDYASDAETCASDADLTSKLVGDIAGEVTSVGASGGILVSTGIASLLEADGALALFGGAVAAVTAVTMLFSLHKSDKSKECDHQKVRLTTKEPTCTEKGKYQVVCSICGTQFDSGDISPLGHNWSSWAVAKIDELLMEVTKTRQCTRCKEKEEKKDRLAIADLKIAYSDDGTNYVEDEYSVDGTGAHSKCSVYFTDYQSLLSGSLTHAVDEEGAGNFTFVATEKNGYEFVGWYTGNIVQLTDQAHAAAPKYGRQVYYARFKKRTLKFEYKLYDGDNKGGGSAKSGKLKVEVGEKTYEKSFDKDNKSCTISIDNEYLMPDSVFKVTLAAEPDDKCAYLKDVRTDYNGSAGVGTKDRVISSSTDDDIHVMKKTEHKYNVTMAELLLNGKQNIDKVQFATDLEKGMKIKVDKTDTEKFEGCSTKIRYKLNGEEKWKTATDGITMIYKSGDKFKLSATAAENMSFDGWRMNSKIITTDTDYESTVYADAVYTPIFRSTVIRANYVDVFNNFIATQEIGERPPTPFTYAGYEFTGWDKEPTEVIEDGEIITAQYKRVHDKVTVTADGCTITGKVDGRETTADNTLDVDFDTYVTVKKEGTTCWKVGDKIVAYGEEYTFLANVNLVFSAVAESQEEQKPLVIIVNVNRNDAESYLLEFLATRWLPENCTLIQAGFVYGKDLTDDDLKLENVGKQGSNENSGKVKVGYCESTGNNGEFYLIYGIQNMDAPATAKAFISYTDENNEVKVLYSDMEVFIYE